MKSARSRALPPGVEIRMAESRDVRRLRSYFSGLPRRDRWLRFAGEWMPSSHDLQQRLGGILVAVDVERHVIVGELMYCWPDWQPLGVEHIGLSVAPAYRKHGIAKELFRAWRLGARSRFVRFALAEQVRPGNRPANAVLRSLGFGQLAANAEAPFVSFALDLGPLVIGRLDAMADGGAGLRSEGPMCDGFAFRLGGPDGLASPDQLPHEASLGGLIACADDATDLAEALEEADWRTVAGRLLVTSPYEGATELAREHGLLAGGEQLALIEDDGSHDLNAVLANPAVLGVITDRPAAVKRLRDGQN